MKNILMLVILLILSGCGSHSQVNETLEEAKNNLEERRERTRREIQKKKQAELDVWEIKLPKTSDLKEQDYGIDLDVQ